MVREKIAQRCAAVLRHAFHRRQEALAGMGQINVARITEGLGRIVRELAAIDGWLTLMTESVLNGTLGPREDWIGIHEVRAMIPGYPKMNLVRSWIYCPGIPHYRTGRMLLFRRQEIEEWIEWQQKHGTGDYWTKRRKYKEE